MNINPAQNLVAYFMKQHFDPQIIAQNDYLMKQVQILKAQVKRLELSDRERSQLADLGKKLKDLNKDLFESSTQIVRPKTVLEWHRKFIAKKFDTSHMIKKKGRPRASQAVVDIVIRVAEETNEGVSKVFGRITKLGVDISETTVRNIMRKHGFPRKKTSNEYDPTWSEFLKTHRHSLLGTDFFTVEVWNKWMTRLITYYVLVFIHHGTRKLWIGGITTNPNPNWTTQMARNFVYDFEDKPLITHLIHDADNNFKGGFEDVFESEGVTIKRGSCRTNSLCERMNQTVQHECTNRLIFIGENSLRRTLKEFEVHYNTERSHQGIGNEIPEFPDRIYNSKGDIKCDKRLGGLLKYYYREAS